MRDGLYVKSLFFAQAMNSTRPQGAEALHRILIDALRAMQGLEATSRARIDAINRASDALCALRQPATPAEPA